METLKEHIRSIPDFPKKGINFRDITTLIGDGPAFKRSIDLLYKRYKDKGIDAVVCIESRGFVFGAALAYALGCAAVPVRKKGKLPYKTLQATYALEYGTDTLEMHEDALKKGNKVVIADDLLATGGTAKAVIELAEKLGAKVFELAFIIELASLGGRKKLEGYQVYSLVTYDSE
ncbi:MAG: adenine phosphoribosyltransferase [Candidatus Omnitrophica bacterium]|nr:adenine phosphoribosyltransferase [Candidatus Omnitrophota bacterium]